MSYSIWHIPRDAWQPGPTLPSGIDLEAEFTALLPELSRRLAERTPHEAEKWAEHLAAQLVEFGARNDGTQRR